MMDQDYIYNNALPFARMYLERLGLIQDGWQNRTQPQSTEDYVRSVYSGGMPQAFQNNSPAMPTMGGRADDYIKMAYDAMPVQAFSQNMVQSPMTQQVIQRPSADPRAFVSSKPSGGK